MSEGRAAPQRAPGDELAAELERMLRERLGPGAAIAKLERRPHAYRTSFPLEELDVTLADGARLRLMLKDSSRDALSADAFKAKPEFLHDPDREIETYRRILAPARLGTPELYGTSVDEQRGRHWLVIEYVDGEVLWQIGEHDVWEEAARWLARMHERFGGRLDESWTHLIFYDAPFYRAWMARALRFAREAEPAHRAQVEWLAERYDEVVERLAHMPRTFVHGEFYPSNVMIVRRPGSLRICPIDWEVAAIAPGLVDLAALTTGGWSDTERAALVRAYADCRKGDATPADGLRELERELDFCRLHLAVQWLGWEPTWSPPAEHRQDWLTEAARLAAALGL